MAWFSVARCRSVFLVAGQFGTGAEMSWFRIVLGPNCLDTHFRTLVTLCRVRVRVRLGLELRLGLVRVKIRVRVG